VSLGSRQREDGDTKDLLCHLAVMQQSGARHTGRGESDSPPPIWFGGELHRSLVFSCFKRTGEGDTCTLKHHVLCLESADVPGVQSHMNVFYLSLVISLCI